MSDLVRMIDVAGMIVAALLTICVLSYLTGFKGLYRLALHLLIGVGVTYAMFMAVRNILYPDVFEPLQATLTGGAVDYGKLLVAVASLLSFAFLMLKLSRSLAPWGNVAIGYMVGVGLGVAAGGAVLGTLIAQGAATAGAGNADDLSVVVGALGTLTVLLSFTFTFTWRKGPLKIVTQLMEGLSAIGRFFVYVALGAAFASVYVASVSVLIGQVQWLFSAVSAIGAALANWGIGR